MTDDQFPNSPCAKIARDNQIPIYQLQDIYSKIEKNQIEIDLAVSFVYWKKIEEPLISFPQYKVINFHPAPLPDYKGTGGYNLAILEELDQWAVTAHYIDKEFDTGEIIDIFHFSIYPNIETVVSLEKKSQDFLLSLYKKTVSNVQKNGLLSSNKQTNSPGRYVFWFPPYTGAFVEINGIKYTLINQEILNSLAPSNETNFGKQFSDKKKQDTIIMSSWGGQNQ